MFRKTSDRGPVCVRNYAAVPSQFYRNLVDFRISWSWKFSTVDWTEPTVPVPDEIMSELVCPKCGAPMKLVSILPKVDSYPELRTFRCDSCHWMETRVAE